MNQRRQTTLAKANAKQWPSALSLFNLLSARSIHDVRVNLRAIIVPFRSSGSYSPLKNFNLVGFDTSLICDMFCCLVCRG